ncbi:sensor histidine kinase [Rhodococcus sp. HNM0569]|uniref:sensor histidine kinase n=1 Tax=Rhodococcus sp. HNM0569 TaxID=2716340 RepID=UPI00146E0790|nr:sensor histidine kinase [Rhodococcus sp. HNM0569]NLU85087.1 sensor histidine kinase [Rhodococcus sp. HNM0569]
MHNSFTSVFAGIRASLHVLVVALTAVVFVRALLQDPPHAVWVCVLCVVFFLVYAAGVALGARGGRLWVWLTVLTLVWFALVALAPDAAYIVFGLFFLYLHLLRPPWGVLAVVASTAVAIAGTAAHNGLSAAVVIGPVIGACVAVAIAYGYRALFREAAERQRLIDELVRTRAELAAQERRAGTLAERERLAAEIHDTVAQGLSSIQMLLHSVERAAPDHPALDRIHLAREAASESLAETRQLIAGLTPAALEGKTLADALTRMCDRAADDSLHTEMVTEGDPVRLPMRLEAAFVRIAQSAVSNVVRHAHASRMRVTLTYSADTVSLDVVDDGVGFDPESMNAHTGENAGTEAPSYGLGAMLRRVEAQGGTMSIESEPGLTAIAVSFPLDGTAQDATGPDSIGQEAW